VGPIVYGNIVIEGMLAFAALHYFLLWWHEAREAFLHKPFALQAFASKVRQILDQE